MAISGEVVAIARNVDATGVSDWSHHTTVAVRE
jgi:hypothetical protein